MPRIIEFTQPVDTSMFSAAQLQPRVVASLTWNAVARWLRANVVSLPALIRDESTGLVALGFHVEVQGTQSFFDGDELTVRAGMRVHRGGERLALTARMSTASGASSAVRLVLHPVLIEEPTSLAAQAGPLGERVMERFQADEIDASTPPRVVPERRAAIELGRSPVAEVTRPFRIHRHQTEVADQWAWGEALTLVEPGREELALAPGATPLVRRTLGAPISRLDAEFSRPFYSFDGGEVTTRVYDVDGCASLVHHITSDEQRVLHATLVEVYR